MASAEEAPTTTKARMNITAAIDRLVGFMIVSFWVAVVFVFALSTRGVPYACLVEKNLMFQCFGFLWRRFGTSRVKSPSAIFGRSFGTI